MPQESCGIFACEFWVLRFNFDYLLFYYLHITALLYSWLNYPWVEGPAGRMLLEFDGGIILDAGSQSPHSVGFDFLLSRLTTGVVIMVDVDFIIRQFDGAIILTNTWFDIWICHHDFLADDADRLAGSAIFRNLSAGRRTDVFLAAGRENETG